MTGKMGLLPSAHTHRCSGSTESQGCTPHRVGEEGWGALFLLDNWPGLGLSRFCSRLGLTFYGAEKIHCKMEKDIEAVDRDWRKVPIRDGDGTGKQGRRGRQRDWLDTDIRDKDKERQK